MKSFPLKIVNSFSLLFLMVLSQNFCFAQAAADIRIAKFKDNKACAISYTFDDGLKEHYTLVTPWLNKLGIKGSFVINGSKVNREENTINDTIHMTWENLKEMAAAGHEISNHGWAHKNFGKFKLDSIIEDINKNDSAIFANIGIMPRTFFYPNNTKTPEGIKLASENRIDTRTFQRSLGGNSNAIELEQWVNKLLNDHDWGVTMTHGITYGYDHFTSPNILWEHLKKVKAMEDKIWVGTFRDVAGYVKERDSTMLHISQSGKGHYIITSNCSLNKTLFTEKLTLVIDQKNFKQVKVRQGKNYLIAKTQSDKVLFEFDPFGEIIDVDFQTKR